MILCVFISRLMLNGDSGKEIVKDDEWGSFNGNFKYDRAQLVHGVCRLAFQEMGE